MNSKQRTVIVVALFIIAALLVVPVQFDYYGRLVPLSTYGGRGGFMSSDFFRVARTVALVAAGFGFLFGKTRRRGHFSGGGGRGLVSEYPRPTRGVGTIFS